MAIPEASLPSVGPPLPQSSDPEANRVYEIIRNALDELYRAVRTLSERALPDEAVAGDVIAGQLQSPVTIHETSTTPGLPAAGDGVIWLDASGRLWITNDLGVTRPLDNDASGGGGGIGHDRQYLTFGRAGFNATNWLFCTGQTTGGASQGYLIPRTGYVTAVTVCVFGGIVITPGNITIAVTRGAVSTPSFAVAVPGGGAVNSTQLYSSGTYTVNGAADTLSVNCTFNAPLAATINCVVVVELTTP